jgi:TPR repeat protein
VRLVDKYAFPGTAGAGAAGELPSPNAAASVPPVQLPAELDALLGVAVPIIISCTTQPFASVAATALYLRARLLASGAYPDLLPRDQRQAFRDYEHAAKAGENRAWYRLGRDYEGVGDLGRARECFEKGVSRGDCECAYVSSSIARSTWTARRTFQMPLARGSFGTR